MTLTGQRVLTTVEYDRLCRKARSVARRLFATAQSRDDLIAVAVVVVWRRQPSRQLEGLMMRSAMVDELRAWGGRTGTKLGADREGDAGERLDLADGGVDVEGAALSFAEAEAVDEVIRSVAGWNEVAAGDLRSMAAGERNVDQAHRLGLSEARVSHRRRVALNAARSAAHGIREER